MKQETLLIRLILFQAGWLDGDEVLGRPSAPLVTKDGSLLISDDMANVIYRITYTQ